MRFLKYCILSAMIDPVQTSVGLELLVLVNLSLEINMESSQRFGI